MEEMDKLLNSLHGWSEKVERECKYRWHGESQSSHIFISLDLWNELGELLGFEDDDPKSMGWVGSDGLP